MHPRNIAIPKGIRRFIPGRSSTFGPPRKSLWISDYVKISNCSWREVHPQESVKLGDVYDVRGDRVFYRELPIERPSAGVLMLPGASVYGRHGWVVTSDDFYLYDTNHWFWNPDKTPCFKFFKRQGDIVNLKGKTLNLLSWCAEENYYHWLLEMVPRLSLFTSGGGGFDDIDNILIPNNELVSARRFLARLNLPQRKFIFPSALGCFKCEYLIQPSHPGAPGFAPKWSVDFLRQTVGANNREAGRRLFVLRGKGRRCLENELEIAESLQKHGFEIFDHDLMEDEVGAFQSASIVVGAHGAGLARVAFCHPNTKVVELISDRWVAPYFRTLSYSSGHQYYASVGHASQLGEAISSSFKIDKDMVLDKVISLI